MSSRADDLAAKAARLRARAQPAQPVVDVPERSTDLSTSVDQYPQASQAASLSVRTKPVRLSVDIPPADHAALVRLGIDAAAQLGATRVPGQELVRALIHRMLNDPQMQQQIIADVEQARRRR